MKWWPFLIMINMQAKPYGDSVIAGMGAVTRVVSLVTLMVFGFIKGLQPIAGFSYGAKNFPRLKEAIKTSVIWTTIFCIILGIIFIFGAENIISSFSDGDMNMINVGRNSLIANGFSVMLFGFYTVYSSLFLALGKAKEGLFLGICRQGICFIPIILVLPRIFGLNGILYAQPVSDLLSAIITVFMAIKLSKELNKAQKSV